MDFLVHSVPIILIIFAGCGTSGKVSGAGFELEIASLEGRTDTVTFHIGSPIFLRVDGVEGRGCSPQNGRFFIFSERDMQLNWGFSEVSDSTVLPRSSSNCARYLMLTSEESNALAEGYYKVSVALLLDEKNRRVSDTIVLNPIHAESANASSFGQFLLEQIVTKAPLLSNNATIVELFSGSLPKSKAISLYESFIRYRMGDISGARTALRTAGTVGATRTSTSTYLVELHERISMLIGE